MLLSVKSLIRRKDQELPLTLTSPAGGIGEFFPGVCATGDLSFNGQLTHLESGFLLLSGTTGVGAEVPCDRCLKPCAFHLDCTVQGYFVPERNLDLWEESPHAAEVDDYEVYTGDKIDVETLLLKCLIAVIPTKVLCQEDCQGLCPSCGQDLNEKKCHCEVEEAEGGHPFAKLKKLL